MSLHLHYLRGLSRRGGGAVPPTPPLVPTLTTVSPNSGDVAGSTNVTLTGTNFQGDATVTFAGTTASSIIIVSSTTITCVSPAHASGAVDVVVSQAGGTATKTNGFTYQSTSVPNFDSSTMTSVWYDTFSSYADGSTPSSAYAGLGTPGSNHLKLGTVTIDASVAPPGASKSCKMTVTGGCQSLGTDADVGLERNCASLDSNWNSTALTWYMECDELFDANYYDFNCGGEFKEFLIFRLPGGDSTGRFSFLATKNGSPLVCPDFYSGDVVPVGTIGWSGVSAVETGTTKPSGCTGDKPYYRQHLAQTTKRPVDIDDGSWHHKVIKIRRESALDAGDGYIGMWIDNVQTLKFDGKDATDLAYGQVYTRTTPMMRPFQYACIVNQALSSTKSRWVCNLRIYRNTDNS